MQGQLLRSIVAEGKVDAPSFEGSGRQAEEQCQLAHICTQSPASAYQLHQHLLFEVKPPAFSLGSLAIHQSAGLFPQPFPLITSLRHFWCLFRQLLSFKASIIASGHHHFLLPCQNRLRRLPVLQLLSNVNFVNVINASDVLHVIKVRGILDMNIFLVLYVSFRCFSSGGLNGNGWELMFDVQCLENEYNRLSQGCQFLPYQTHHCIHTTHPPLPYLPHHFCIPSSLQLSYPQCISLSIPISK